MSVGKIIGKGAGEVISELTSTGVKQAAKGFKVKPITCALKKTPINFKAAKFTEGLEKSVIAPKTLWERIIEMIPKTKGIKGGYEIADKETLKLIVGGLDLKESDRKVIDAFLKRARRPRVQVGYKNSKNGFSVAGLRLYDGKSPVGSVAISMTNPGQVDNVVKARLSLGRKSQVLYANGYVDGSQKVDLLADDISYSASRKAGETKVDASIDGKMAVHTTSTQNEKEQRRIASYFGCGKKFEQMVEKGTQYLAAPTEKLNQFLQLITTGKKAV